MILFFGDLHADFSHVLPLVMKLRPEAIILLGDLESPMPLEQVLGEVMKLTEVWWIPGNHDSDNLKSYHNLYGSDLASRNLHGRVVEIVGVRVAGLGGVFRESVWYPRHSMEAPQHYANYESAGMIIMAAERAKMLRANRERYRSIDEVEIPLIGKALTHKTTIFPDVWEGLCKQRADVLVTHEAPDCHHNGFVAITELAQQMGVNRLFHGHHHDCRDYSSHRERMGFNAYGVGLRGVTDQDGRAVRAGILDEQRGR